MGVRILTGQVFGRWTVGKQDGIKNRRAQWKCVCTCGTKKTVDTQAMTSGKSKSCGCLRPEVNRRLNTLPPGEVVLRTHLATYKRSAKKRSHVWDIPEKEFRSLVAQPCFYCGYTPDTRINGLDRIDNVKGYTLENCRTCCKICNYAKNTMSEKEFFDWVRRVYSRIAPEQAKSNSGD